ncbi:hypothetical protein CMV_000279 [Castanea mollissima]|uniref:Uncharacterized protein n=1 Tax=Castanea mollissima TaxID=60419 RepID=A0A8J4RMR4_9ROSI|nr:hypothetical protein CMV_000279 [Castanea mollissima]
MGLGFERRRRQRNGFGSPTLPAMKGVWGFYGGAGDETGLGVRVSPAMKWVFGLESESVQLTELIGFSKTTKATRRDIIRYSNHN